MNLTPGTPFSLQLGFHPCGSSTGDGLNRRQFLGSAALGLAAMTLPAGCATQPPARGAGEAKAFDALSRSLLRQWCDGMLAVQIHHAANPAEHGALGCPACGFIHGRCMDAVYPFLHMAKVTGDKKYLEAGIAVFEWSENVSQEDGSWTVIADPKSWKGITIFGAIALAETLHHHGGLLDETTRQRWYKRLGRAGDYIYENFTALDFSNINYGCTGVYGMYLLGRVLNRPAYLERSRKLASEFKDYLTQPNGLLFGEGKPVTGRSPRGCQPVDLGYNVEESLVSLALYADATGDPELTALVVRVLQNHLQFMLPDGAWDNSWGTRQFKWTYWGSRTSDGCQPGYAVLAKHDPAFATAVYENTLLYQRCTGDGLLHGGPHYVSHGVKPCVHHTFTHAKALAAVLDHGDLARRLQPTAPLPRAVADGVREYPEIATWLAARGPWRATITAYDWVYKNGVYHPTGGALSLLWHRDVGPLLAGSMAEYLRSAESNNMQPNPHPDDHSLTPRLEVRENGTWFTHLHDGEARVAHTEEAGAIVFEVDAQLLSADQAPPAAGPVPCALAYRFDPQSVTLQAKTDQAHLEAARTALVLPLISPTGERVRQVSGQRIEIVKPGGTVVVEANVPLRIQKTGQARVFNLVPGFEAVPVVAAFPAEPSFILECRICVKS